MGPRTLPRPTLSKSNMKRHKSQGTSTIFCGLVWQNKTFLKKNRFRSYLRGFRRRQTITELGKKWGGSEKRSPFRNIAPQRKPPDITILDTFATSHRSFKKKCHDHAFLFYACFCFSYFFGKKMLPETQAPQSHCSCPATTPNHSTSFFQNFYDLHSEAFFARFSEIWASIKNFLKKQASKPLSCRGGLGEAPYNTPRHSLQRCRSKVPWKVGIRKLILFEISYLKVLKGS